MEELTFEQWHYKNYASGTDDISDEDYDERYMEYMESTTKQRLYELNKLEEYLAAHNYKYERIDEEDDYINQHQLIVYDDEGTRLWDAICNRGSYGYEEGLLEIMGTLVDPKAGDDVEGFLRANEIIIRLEDE